MFCFKLISGKFILTIEEKIIKAEIVWALNCVKNNFSFASNIGNANIFLTMFPDSEIAKQYNMSETKCKYIVQFAIAPYVKELLLDDFRSSPFTFKFDESTTKQVKKQYDGYVQYFSKTHNRVISAYTGSLFVGHCRSKDLIQHFFEFGTQLQWDVKYLLHLGMDGPNVNLAFQKDLISILKNEYNKKIVDIGTCSLHPVHTAYGKGLKTLSIDVEKFTQELHFFFKYSSARREDFGLASDVTNVKTANMLRHVSSRWLSIRQVLKRIIEQWDNLVEYFIKQLPREKQFEKEVGSTARYKYIAELLKKPDITKMYLMFTLNIAEDLQVFLTKFQADEPLVHVLYPAYGDLLFTLMNKFVKHQALYCDNNKLKDAKDLGKVNLKDKSNIKHQIEVDVSAGVQKILNKIEKTVDVFQIRNEFRNCMIAIVDYLQHRLPLDNIILHDLQYLHPQLKYHENSTGSICRLSTTIGQVFSSVLQKTFSLTEGFSIERFVELIKSQWLLYQTEDIPASWYLAEEGATRYLRIDSYWNNIGSIRDLQGNFKYQQLHKLAECCLSLSHANATPERGFSLNKAVLECKESLNEETIVALRLVKDALLIYGGIESFPINKKLFGLAKCAYNSYDRYLQQKRAIELEAERQKKEKEGLKAQNTTNESNKRKLKSKLQELNSALKAEGIKLEVAEKMIAQGNENIKSALSKKVPITKEEMTAAHMLITTGLEKSREIKETIKSFEKQISEAEQKITEKKTKN